jgi:hypothetical protein
MIRDRLSSFLADRAAWLALMAYALLTAVMTWPVVARLNTHVPGGNVDLWTHRWTYWWIKQAIIEGRNPFYTDLLFHPQGVSLAFHNIAWINIALWLPLQAIVGGDTAYGLTFLFFCTLNGFAMFLLARELVDSPLAAFIGGLIFGFWPATMSQFGHPNMKVTCWVPLALLCMQRTLDRGRVKDALMTGLFVALTGLTRWQILLMAAVLFILYLAWEFLQDRTHWNRRTMGLLILAGLVAGALMAPLATPVASALLACDNLDEVLFTEEVGGQTDLLAYVLPTPYHPLWNKGAERLYANFTHNKVFVPFLGYSALALALYGAVRRRRQALLWLLVAGVYIVLALGPLLRVNGQLYPRIPMPYRLVGDLFVIRAVRLPNRFNLLLALPMAALVTLGVAALTDQRSRRTSILVTVLLTALVLREYSLVPYHTERPKAPDWCDRLAQEPGQFAVLDLPVGLQTYNKRYMFYQITHRKPLVEGKISRLPPRATAFLESRPFLLELHEHSVMDPGLVNVSFQLSALADANVRYIVLHKDLASPSQLRVWQDWLTFAPVHQDEDVLVYRTDPRWNRDYTFSSGLTERIGLIQVFASPTEPVQGEVVRVDARWGSSAEPDQDYDVCLDLVSASGQLTQPHCVPLSPTWPASRWREDEIVRSSYVLGVPLSLEPGGYSLLMTLSDPADGSPIGEPADLGLLRVKPLQPVHSLRSTFGGRVCLLGYDPEHSPEALSLTFYWRALREMETSFKVFVHLTDPASGDIIAQTDAVPRNWTYPTDRWIEGEVVRDTVTLPLGDIEAGHYALTVGWYDSLTGRRLEAYDSGGERHPTDAVPLMPMEVE